VRAFHFETVIARSPERVWSVLTDLSLAPKWRPLIVSMATVDGGPLAVGKGVRIVHEFLGERRERVSITDAFEPNRRWRLHSSQPAIDGWFDFVLEPVPAGTRVVATAELKARSFTNWLLLPLIARGERRWRVEMVDNLKRLVESGEVSS
jgi:uncharacterized protein YndB with AHSA1/START domain